MIIFDKKQGMATDVGEYWGPNDANPTPNIVEISLGENLDEVEFSYQVEGNRAILSVPVDRLKRLLR